MNWWIVVAALLGAAVGALSVALKRPRQTEIPRVDTDESTPDPRSGALGLLALVPHGVILLDRELHPQASNPAADELLGLRVGPLPRHLPAPRLAAIARAAVESGSPTEDIVEISFPKRRDLHVRASLVEDGAQVLLLLQDVSEERRTKQARREFVAHASHELKSPVASLKALTEAVVDAQAEDAEEAARLARRLLLETERLSELVVDLLDLSRLEEPEHRKDQPLDLTAIAGSELGSAQRASEQAGSILRGEIDPGLEIRGDEQQVRLLIRNLLDNAIRYTPSGGAVTLRARRTDDLITVSVEDTGIGIPMEAQARVFERFYRVDRARSRERGGTGLGLAIVKHAVEQHGGTITLRSEVGRGSTFTIALPVTGSDRQEAV